MSYTISSILCRVSGVLVYLLIFEKWLERLPRWSENLGTFVKIVIIRTIDWVWYVLFGWLDSGKLISRSRLTQAIFQPSKMVHAFFFIIHNLSYTSFKSNLLNGNFRLYVSSHRMFFPQVSSHFYGYLAVIS